jgi:hypothetical protein
MMYGDYRHELEIVSRCHAGIMADTSDDVKHLCTFLSSGLGSTP